MICVAFEAVTLQTASNPPLCSGSAIISTIRTVAPLLEHYISVQETCISVPTFEGVTNNCIPALSARELLLDLGKGTPSPSTRPSPDVGRGQFTVLRGEGVFDAGVLCFTISCMTNADNEPVCSSSGECVVGIALVFEAQSLESTARVVDGQLSLLTLLVTEKDLDWIHLHTSVANRRQRCNREGLSPVNGSTKQYLRKESEDSSRSAHGHTLVLRMGTEAELFLEVKTGITDKLTSAVQHTQTQRLWTAFRELCLDQRMGILGKSGHVDAMSGSINNSTGCEPLFESILRVSSSTPLPFLQHLSPYLRCCRDNRTCTRLHGLLQKLLPDFSIYTRHAYNYTVLAIGPGTLKSTSSGKNGRKDVQLSGPGLHTEESDKDDALGHLLLYTRIHSSSELVDIELLEDMTRGALIDDNADDPYVQSFIERIVEVLLYAMSIVIL